MIWNVGLERRGSMTWMNGRSGLEDCVFVFEKDVEFLVLGE